MSKKRNKKKGKRSEQGDVMAKQAFDAKRQAIQDGYGAPGPRVWTQTNKRAATSRNACRGPVAY